MTNFLEIDDSWQQLPFATELSSRPEEPWPCGPPKVMKMD
jgi:hypothetical protein